MALNPYFSKRQINDFCPYIQERANQLCERLLGEYKGTYKMVTMNDAWAAFATDVIMYYGFAWSYDFLNYPEFVTPFATSIKELALSVHVAGHFPLFLKFLQSVPNYVVGIINPAMQPVFQFQNVFSSSLPLQDESDLVRKSNLRLSKSSLMKTKATSMSPTESSSKISWHPVSRHRKSQSSVFSKKPRALSTQLSKQQKQH